MNEENLVWDIDPLDPAADSPRKAHFLWRRGNVPIRAAAFGLIELQAEIVRREEARLDATEFRRAHDRLARPQPARA